MCRMGTGISVDHCSASVWNMYIVGSWYCSWRKRERVRKASQVGAESMSVLITGGLM
jgi:hypothetical protein